MKDSKADSQAFRSYIESRVFTAPPVEIVHMLYQVATDNLKTAIGCLDSNDRMGRARAVTKSQTAIYELMASLDPAVSQSLCGNLARLYDYVQRQIIVGHTRQSAPAFEDALSVLTTLSEGWSGVRASVMGQNQATNVELYPAPDAKSEAAPQRSINRLYSELAQRPELALEVSC